MRKEMRLRIEEYVKAEIAFEENEDLALVKDRRDYLGTEIRAKKLKLTMVYEKEASMSEGCTRDWEINGRKITIKMQKIVEAEPRRSMPS